MTFQFHKYDATGNDFIVVDNRNSVVDPFNRALWARLCTRRKGVGADGVLFVEESLKFDFRMIYLNSDGNEAEMCGNGARAIAHFYAQLEHADSVRFETQNGIYAAQISGNDVAIEMSEIADEGKYQLNALFDAEHSFFINTGVPHAVFFVNNVEEIDVRKYGREVRMNSMFPNGCNVNFVSVAGNGEINIRTYERGVEDETLSCGTGVLASAIACAKWKNWDADITVNAHGGVLSVSKVNEDSRYLLRGNVNEVYTATCTI